MKKSYISLVLSSVIYGVVGAQFVWADDDATLDTIDVIGNADAVKKYDVTRLGNIEKNTAVLKREQIENIRDLTRYDPGIGVNEAGGRGSSRGFSMRGVEKERIAVNVDGLGAAPILRRIDRYGTHASSTSSSSISEVEYENLKEVDIRKGASSTEGGSGALGGSVNMKTKDPSDILMEGKELGGRLKAGYTSKDKRWVYSAAVAGKHNGLEGLLQYTERKGHEIRAHNSLYKQGQHLKHYNTDVNSAGSTTSYFYSESVSGPQRKVPNPLDYKSKSILAKFGYEITPSHRVGLLFESIKQHYTTREMFLSNYHFGSTPVEGSYLPIYDETPSSNMKLYTPTRYYLDKNHNNRIGVEYRYKPEKMKLFDELALKFNYRDILLSGEVRQLNCSLFPKADIGCWTDPNTPGQRAQSKIATLKTKDNKLELELDKTFSLWRIDNQIKINTGVMHSTYNVQDKTYRLNAKQENKKILRESENSIFDTGSIKGQNLFFSINDKISLLDNLEASFALRYDYHNFSASPSVAQQMRGNNFHGAKYHNKSWDVGLSYRPIDSVRLSYRNSSGYRVPSVVEQLGSFFNLGEDLVDVIQPPLNAEKSFNQEVGFEYVNTFLRMSASYFVSRYQDIIDYAAKYCTDCKTSIYYAYYNIHNFKTHGFDLDVVLDGNAIWNKLPPGLLFFGKLGQTKVKKQQAISSDFHSSKSYAFDAIQPMKLVYGISYDSPDDKWGVSLINTYSKTKDPSELLSISKYGTLTIKGARFSVIKPKSWLITDLTGYYNFNKNITLRAGIYNLYNYKYVTWESARQTAFGLDARISTNNYSALSAPGRNYLVSVEIKF